MARYVLKRLLLTIPVALGVSFIVFFLIHLVPGDPVRVMLGVRADSALVEQVRESMGFNRPMLVQYGDWLWGLLRGDLGTSYLTGEPVMTAIMQRWPATMSLAFASILLALVVAVPLGVLSALKPYGPLGMSVLTFTQIGVAVPGFWLALMLILVFGEHLRWLPVSGFVSPTQDAVQWARHLILPAITIAVTNAAVLTRFVRSSTMETLQQHYIRTARAKGLSEALVVGKHALRNALIPTITMSGMQLAWTLGGSVVVEMVFAWPGLGRLALDAIQRRDYPLVQGSILFVALTFVLVNLVVDLIYAWVDPRIKY